MDEFIDTLLKSAPAGSLFPLLEDLGTGIIMKVNEAKVNFINSGVQALKNLFFSYKDGWIGPIVLFNGVIGLFAATLLVIITLKKGAQNLFNMAGNENYVPATQLVMDVIKSSGLAVFFPWLTAFIMGFLPLFGELALGDALSGGQFYINSGITCFGNFISDEVAATLNGGWRTGISQLLNPGWWIPAALFNWLMVITIVCFMVKMCKFQVEMVIMDVTSVVAAIDSATDKKEFYELWVQSYKAVIVDFVFNCLVFGLYTTCLGIIGKTPNPLTSPYFVLAIGAAACLMKGTVLSNKFKQGGLSAGGVSTVANVARTATMMARF